METGNNELMYCRSVSHIPYITELKTQNDMTTVSPGTSNLSICCLSWSRVNYQGISIVLSWACHLAMVVELECLSDPKSYASWELNMERGYKRAGF